MTTSRRISPASSPSQNSADTAEKRKVLKAMVETSTRVFGVIYSCLPEDLRKQTEHIKSGFAYGLWKWLEDKFQSTEQDSVVILIDQWSALRQDEDESFDAYRARVDKLSTLLAHANEKPSARVYSYMLLDRLRSQYKPAVLALKAGGQLNDAENISWDTVAALINSHEREVLRQDDSMSDGTRISYANAVHGRGRPAGERSDRKQSNSGVNGSNRDTRECFTCHEIGHISRYCPNRGNNNGGNRGRKGNGGTGVNNRSNQQLAESEEYASAAVRHRGGRNKFEVFNDEEEQSDDENDTDFVACAIAVRSERVMAAASTALTKEQQGNIAKAKENKKLRESAEKAAAKILKKSEKPLKMPDLLTSGTVPKDYSQLDKALNDGSWGVDSMASVSVSGNKKEFKSLRPMPPMQIKTADGSMVTATHCGTIALRVTSSSGKNLSIPINDVWYSDKFASNLLSAMRLTKLGWEMHVSPQSAYMVTPGGSKVNLHTRARITVMLGAAPERVYMSLNPPAPGQAAAEDARIRQRALRLHERLGHMGVDRMLKLLSSGKISGVGAHDEKELKIARTAVLACRSCALGKQARASFEHRGLDHGQAKGEVLHMDTYVIKWNGKDQVKKTNYGIAVVDSFTGHYWHSFVSTKDLVAKAVIDMLKQIECTNNSRIKRIFTDGGSEFINQTLKGWLISKGVTIQSSPPHTQQLNGVAERSIRTVKDMGRTLIHHAQAPGRLWRDAINHSLWLWNRTHVSKHTGKTPYELARGRLPSLKEKSLGVWGCDAFVHQRKELRDGTMAPKSEPAIYLGQSMEESGSIALILRTMKRVVTRDIKFNNASFVHMRAMTTGQAEVDAVLDGTSPVALTLV